MRIEVDFEPQAQIYTCLNSSARTSKTTIKRVPYHDLYVYFSDRHLILLSYNIEREEVKRLRIFKDYHKDVIGDIKIFGDSVFSISDGKGDTLKIINISGCSE